MFNKVSNKTLLIIFGVLVVIAAVYIVVESEQGEKSFKTDIVNIDTSRVTAISIYPRANDHREIKIYKEGSNNWKVNLDNNKTASVPESKVKSILDMLVQVKPTRVAAQDKSKWAEFKVDTAGTRVKVFEGGNNTLDLIVGKFSFQQPRQMNTFVRLNGEDEVYETQGFLDMAFNQKPDYFRNNVLLSDEPLGWKKLTFTYPDSSFELIKNDDEWLINGVKTDSAKTAGYLRTLSHLSSTSFEDNVPAGALGKSNYTLTIESASKGGIVLAGYRNNSDVIVTSTENDGAYFNGSQNKLFQKIFIGKEHLLN